MISIFGSKTTTPLPISRKLSKVWISRLCALLGLFIFMMALAHSNSDSVLTQANRSYAQCAEEVAAANRMRDGGGTFIAGVCEKQRASFVKKYGSAP